MMNFISENQLVLVIGALALGWFFGHYVGVLILARLSRTYKKIQILQDYWKFVIIYLTFVIISYFFVLNFVDSQKVEIWLTVLGHFVALFFAIYVGYYAFLQVKENRLEKLKEKGYRYVKEKSYERAKRTFEQAHIIDVKDFSVLANMLEIYLFLNDYLSFDQKILLCESEVIDNRDHIIKYYLKASRYLLQEDIGNAKKIIKQMIEYNKEEPDSLRSFSWDFSDMKGCNQYSKILGESKTIFKNLIQFLKKSLNVNDEKEFEKGNYSLLAQKK